MQASDLLELRDDLNRESRRLEKLVGGLVAMEQRLSSSTETVEAAALRLHSLYTGVEQILLLVSRVVNGGTPSRGEGWHRRLLERMAMSTETRPAVLSESTQLELQDYLRFRHLVRNLYADELRAEPIEQLISQLRETWPCLDADIAAFQTWLATIAAGASAATNQWPESEDRNSKLF